LCFEGFAKQEHEQSNFEIIAEGTLIHWPDLDEDLSVSGIVAGRRSGESQDSLEKWRRERLRPSHQVQMRKRA